MKEICLVKFEVPVKLLYVAGCTVTDVSEDNSVFIIVVNYPHVLECLTLEKMAIRFLEMALNVYLRAQRHIPENLIFSSTAASVSNIAKYISLGAVILGLFLECFPLRAPNYLNSIVRCVNVGYIVGRVFFKEARKNVRFLKEASKNVRFLKEAVKMYVHPIAPNAIRTSGVDTPGS